MNFNAIEFNSELRKMEKEIDYYKTKLRRCRDKYESLETEIYDVKKLQRKALYVLDTVRLEEEDIHQRLKDIHLSYETCVEKSNNDKRQNEKICEIITELLTQKKALTEELAQLKKKADDNDKKLARVNALITEQEEKNATILRELKRKSNIVTIAQDVKERINIILKYQKTDEAVDNIMQ